MASVHANLELKGRQTGAPGLFDCLDFEVAEKEDAALERLGAKDPARQLPVSASQAADRLHA